MTFVVRTSSAKDKPLKIMLISDKPECWVRLKNILSLFLLVWMSQYVSKVIMEMGYFMIPV